MVRRIFRLLLEEARHTVCATGQADEALTFCLDRLVELAIVDTFLPGEGGLRLIGRLKQEYPHVKILALTGGFLAADHRQRVVRMGVHALLDKPFPPSELLRVVQSMIAPSP